MSEIKSLIERAVRLEEEKRRLAEDLKELYAEAKANGHDVPALKLVVKEQMESEAKRKKREAAEEIADVYRRELGQLADTPLGNAAVKSASEGQSRVNPPEHLERGKYELVVDIADPNKVAGFASLANGKTAVIVERASYTPTPVPAAAPIDLTIPEFLRRTPAQIGGAA